MVGTLFVVASDDLTFGTAADFPEDDRVVDFTDDEPPLLPEQTRDDTRAGWGERSDSNDDRLLDERPPHWD
jgi:hypothetical protein